MLFETEISLFVLLLYMSVLMLEILKTMLPSLRMFWFCGLFGAFWHGCGLNFSGFGNVLEGSAERFGDQF